jgi:hypothetical protein
MIDVSRIFYDIPLNTAGIVRPYGSSHVIQGSAFKLSITTEDMKGSGNATFSATNTTGKFKFYVKYGAFG